MRVTILYEDQNSPANQFGPHELLKRCVKKKLDVKNYSKLGTLVPIPKKGDGNLKKTLKQDGARLSNSGPLIAVFDMDKVRRCYNLDTNACKTMILNKIYLDSELSRQQLTVVLLDRNLESLLDCICQLLGQSSPTKKDLNRRDIICSDMQMAGDDKLNSLQSLMPSFGRLVEKVAQTLRSCP